MSIHDSIQQQRDDLIALRRELHQIPETGLQLPQTQARIEKELEGLPLEFHKGTKTSSIVGILRGGKRSGDDAPLVLLRGDMDGLPVVEATDEGFKSTNGNMHACGHDLHMTILVGAAKALCAMQDELPGDVLFMFQPGEEGYSGAKVMLDEGLLEVAGKRPDACYGIHVWSGQLAPGGTFTTRADTMMAASDVFKCTVKGQGGHGSAPHAANDPVPPMAEMITAIQTMVARHFNVFDPVVVTTGVVKAGSAPNVIPDDAHFECTVRSFSQQSREQLMRRLPELCDGIAASYGIGVEREFLSLYPPTVNTPDEFEFVAQTVGDLFGADRFLELPNPLTGAEDFSFVLQEIPGCFIGLSAVPQGADPATQAYNHSPRATYDDSVCPDGAELLAELAVRRLNR